MVLCGCQGTLGLKTMGVFFCGPKQCTERSDLMEVALFCESHLDNPSAVQDAS